MENGDRDEVRWDGGVGSRKLTDGPDQGTWTMCCRSQHQKGASSIDGREDERRER